MSDDRNRVFAYVNANGLDNKTTSNGRRLAVDCPSCDVVAKSKKCSFQLSTSKWRCNKCNSHGNLAVYIKLRDGAKEEAPVGHDAVDAFATAMMSQVGTTTSHVMTPKKVTDVVLDKRLIDEASFTLNRSSDGACVRAFLKERGISSATANKAKLGVVNGNLCIPLFTGHLPNGDIDVDTLVVGKVRMLNAGPKQPKYYVTASHEPVPLYMPYKLNNKLPLIVVGGEIDTLSCGNCGWTNVVGASLGEGAWPERFNDSLVGFTDIIVIYDNDKAGQQSVEAATSGIGKYRCRVGKWPSEFNDANEMLVGGKLNPLAIHDIINAAKKAYSSKARPAIDNVQETLDWLNRANASGMSTGLDSIDDVIGKMHGGDMVIITGNTGSGKTSLSSQIATSLADDGHDVAMCPFEMGQPGQTVRWVQQFTGEKDVKARAANNNAWFLKNAAAAGRSKGRLYTYDDDDIDVDSLRDFLMYMHSDGFDAIIIDHLHYLIESNDHERQQIEQFMHMVSKIAKDTGMLVIVLMHPSNTETDDTIIQLHHLKGASAIKQLATTVISVHRHRPKDRSAPKKNQDGLLITYGYILKNRNLGTECGLELGFDVNFSTFHDKGMAGGGRTILHRQRGNQPSVQHAAFKEAVANASNIGFL